VGDPLDNDAVIERLNAALPLQQRSAAQWTLVAGSLVGLEMQALTGKFFEFATADLEDARRLVEKIVALGGEPVSDVAPLRFEDSDARKTLEAVRDGETEALEALQAVIPETGNDAPSEALEHLIEHVLLRKQEQLDFLSRAIRR
jgi:bacterioferritin (cytochrome b1)